MSLVIREIKIKTIPNYYYILTRIAITKKFNNINTSGIWPQLESHTWLYRMQPSTEIIKVILQFPMQI